ncbi:uncharacterized protein LOC143193634 [Rhynchophorus ferrugineus]|uniref:uncharacterized protein LOC143193634 n=1 Tax=Rhynchophorus ferrugineus TaxID=354439 RepID=UPI003FCD67E9
MDNELSRHVVLDAVSKTQTLPELQEPSCSPVVKFGWHTIDLQPLPYIIVGDLKYVSVRIINHRLCNNIKKFSPEVYQCFQVNYDPLNKWEACLFNEINFQHCDGQFGKLLFIEGRDTKMLLEDFVHMYEFLKFCVRIMFALNNNMHNDINEDSCGFLQIDGTNKFVPFVVRNGEKYSPMFCFERTCWQPKDKFVKATKWELTYLRFLFRLQGLEKKDIQLNSCDLVNIVDVRQYFDHQESFVPKWPVADCTWMSVGSQMNGNVK